MASEFKSRQELLEELVSLRRREDEIIRELMLKNSDTGTFKEYSNEPVISSNELKVRAIFKELNVPANLKGHYYARTAILMIAENPDLLSAITKGLYPTIAKEYCTTPDGVERAIRYAIKVSWAKGDEKSYQRIFGCSSKTRNKKPKNSEFLAVIVNQLKL